MRTILTAAVAATVIAATVMPALAARTFIASNKWRVVPAATPGQFEVLAQGGGAGADFFCAAAEYAHRYMGGNPTDRVVMVTNVGPSVANPGGRGAMFVLAPRGSAERSGVSISMKAGENMSIAHGEALCEVNRVGRRI